MSRTLKIVLAYDGTGPRGLAAPARRRVGPGAARGRARGDRRPRRSPSSGAGRTDAGVHALGQVASCPHRPPDPGRRSWRARSTPGCPTQVRVLSVEDAADDFHARYGARSKTYRYLVLNDSARQSVRAALRVARAAAARRRRDGRGRAAISRATRFRRAAGGRQRGEDHGEDDRRRPRLRSSRRPMEVGRAAWRFRARPAGGRLVAFEISGNGFLRHMVRNAVGTLVEVGLGQRGRRRGWPTCSPPATGRWPGRRRRRPACSSSASTTRPGPRPRPAFLAPPEGSL